jgi:hypothetical protein
MAYCPRSSLPAQVLAWLARRLATCSLRARPARAAPAAGPGGPPGRRGIGAAGRAVVPPRRPRGRHLQDRGRRQHGPAAARTGRPGLLPARRQLHHQPGQLGEWLAEMTDSGEAVVVDGLGTRVQRPRGWGNQKLLYHAKRHPHTAQGVAVATIHGHSLGWLDGAGRAAATSRSSSPWQAWTTRWIESRSQACWTAASAAWPRPAGTGMRRSATAAPKTPSPSSGGPTTASRRGCAPGRAVDRPSGQRVGAPPLARAVVSRPGRLPRHRRADLPRPLAPPGPYMTPASRTPSIDCPLLGGATARRGTDQPYPAADDPLDRAPRRWTARPAASTDRLVRGARPGETRARPDFWEPIIVLISAAG